MTLEQSLASSGVGLVLGMYAGRGMIDDIAENFDNPDQKIPALCALTPATGYLLGNLIHLIPAIRDPYSLGPSEGFYNQDALLGGAGAAIGLVLGALSKRKRLPEDAIGWLTEYVDSVLMPTPEMETYTRYKQGFNEILREYAVQYPSIATFKTLEGFRKRQQKNENAFEEIKAFYEGKNIRFYDPSEMPDTCFAIVRNNLYIFPLDDYHREKLRMSDDVGRISHILSNVDYNDLDGKHSLQADWDGNLTMFYHFVKGHDFMLIK